MARKNYGDKDTTRIITKAPTIQCFTRRLVLSLAASVDGVNIHSRYITKSTSNLKYHLRDVSIRPSLEVRLPEENILKVMKSLHGIPESGLYGYLTYVEHHCKMLDLKRFRADTCLLFKHDGTSLEALAILQVVDSLIFGLPVFLDEEKKHSQSV